jgi:hypothetical protein
MTAWTFDMVQGHLIWCRDIWYCPWKSSLRHTFQTILHLHLGPYQGTCRQTVTKLANVHLGFLPDNVGFAYIGPLMSIQTNDPVLLVSDLHYLIFVFWYCICCLCGCSCLFCNQCTVCASYVFIVEYYLWGKTYDPIPVIYINGNVGVAFGICKGAQFICIDWAFRQMILFFWYRIFTI